MLYTWFLISARIIHIILIFIHPVVCLSTTQPWLEEYKRQSSLFISACHDHNLTPSTAYPELQSTLSTAYTGYSIHRVQHAPSTVCTEYSIHQVQHTLSTTSTQDCLSSFHCHDYKLTPECNFTFRCTSVHNQPPSAISPWGLNSEATLSHSHITS